MDARELLLEAALKVFAEHGTRGATTRRIAHAAGVNEVTLFRHFGSKEGLLREALATSPRAVAFIDTHLPETPADPEAELTEFCRHHHDALFQSRSVIRKCMGEFEEHPEIDPHRVPAAGDDLRRPCASTSSGSAPPARPAATGIRGRPPRC